MRFSLAIFFVLCAAGVPAFAQSATPTNSNVLVTSLQGRKSTATDPTSQLTTSCSFVPRIIKDYCDGRYDFEVDSCFVPVTDTRFDWYFHKEGAATLIPMGSTFNVRGINFSATIPTAGNYQVVVVVTFTDYATGRLVTLNLASSFVKVMLPPTSPYGDTTPLLRYYNSDTGYHFYNSDWCELGSAGKGYHFESVEGYIYKKSASGRSPLHRYVKGARHFYTTDWGELGPGRSGWIYEGITGYLDKNPQWIDVPLHRMYKSRSGDHFYTTSSAEVTGAAGYGYYLESIEGYLLPPK